MKVLRGILSVLSFQGLLRRLYTGRVQFEAACPKDTYPTIVELARLGDMYNIPVLEKEMSRSIKCLGH